MTRDALQRQHQDAYCTVEEYLTLERVSEFKHEYLAGRIVSMAGASRAHNMITGNVEQRLRNQLEEKPCETYSKDQRVKIDSEHYYYPDVVVVCDEAHFESIEGLDTLTNPTVVIEVLSKSSASDDRGEKFYTYRNIESVKDYILIAQDKMHVEHFTRLPNNEWILHRDVTEPDGKIVIHSLGCELTLSQIYQRVDFPPQIKLLKEDDTTAEA